MRKRSLNEVSILSSIVAIAVGASLTALNLNNLLTLLLSVLTVVILNFTLTKIYLAKNLGKINNLIRKIIDGDYKIRIESPSIEMDETSNLLQELCKNYEYTFEKLVITSINTSDLTDKLKKFIDENLERMQLISENVSSLSNNTFDYFNTISSSSEELKNMNASIKEIGLKMQEAKASTENSKNISESSQGDIENTVTLVNELQQMTLDFKNKIDNLKENTSSIVKISSTIEGISEKTNLLSLNAAIEAARAGEAGRGFSIVAEEIRNLSQGTATSLEDIHKEVKTILANLEETLNATKVNIITGNAMKEMVHNSKDIFYKIMINSQDAESKVDEVFNIINHLTNTIDAVNENVVTISTKTEENLNSAKNSSTVANKLSEDVNVLGKSIDNLDTLSKNLYNFISENTIDKILADRIEKLIPYMKECNNIELCNRIAQDVNISQFQILDSNGEVIAATEEESLGINLFEIYPPYKTFYNNPENKYLFTPIVTRLDGYYARFCAVKIDNELLIGEYSFNIKKDA